jgi:hypothetical protein
MSSKQILFNTEMVKAILDGRKTQTRRPIKIKNKLTRDWALNTGVDWIKVDLKDEKYPYSIREQNGAWNEYSLKDFINKYSQYKVGDVLWVREPAKVKSPPIATCKKLTFKYLADNKITEIYLDDDFDYSKKWIQRCQGVPNGCIKEMARIFLKVINVRVERLQDISSIGYEKEGYKWEDNPYVFVYEFERIEKQ